MDCRAAEELFSDSIEGTLVGAARAELDQHLAGCASCRELREAMREVVAFLAETPVVEAPQDLAARVAEGSQRRRARPGAGPRLAPRWLHGLRLAAAVALIVSGAAFLVPGNSLNRAVSSGSLSNRVVNWGVQLAERKDRLVEDLRMLKVLASTALQGRVERVNESVDDYRRLLEQRRATPPASRKSGLFSNGCPPQSVGLVVNEARSRT